MTSADFTELLIKHLVRCGSVLTAAKRLSMVPEDLCAMDDFGPQVYRTIAKIVLALPSAPVSVELFGLHLRSAIEAGEIHESLIDQVADLYHWIYTGDLNEDYFRDSLPTYIKQRRTAKAVHEHGGNFDELMPKLAQIRLDVDISGSVAEAESVNPFDKLMKKSLCSMVPTGLADLDEALGGGIGYSEYALLVGFSGGGKTALSAFMAGNAAMTGFRVAYLSFEEELADISNRFYSRYFQINYSDLHNGSAVQQLEEKFNLLFDHPDTVKLRNNLKVYNLKERAPMTSSQILELLEQEYNKTGFAPDVVFLDQFQFVDNDEDLEDTSQWNKDQVISKELDALSHKRIGGKAFALWVNHQAKGKLKKRFTREDIHGFKGIIQKADTVLGIGREGELSVEFNIFSLKSRHSKAFEVSYDGQLEYMSFILPASETKAPPVATGYSFGNAGGKAERSADDVQLVEAARRGVAGRPGPPPLMTNGRNDKTQEEAGGQEKGGQGKANGPG